MSTATEAAARRGDMALPGRWVPWSSTWAERPLALGRALVRARLALLVAGIVVLGALPRLWLYGTGRSLWTDEAIIAMALFGIEGAFLEVVTVPTGWFFMVQAVAAIAGRGEHALRAVSLLAGLAALPLTFLFARRLVGAGAAVVATALLAVSGPALYFSNELKPYMLDAVVALLLGLLLVDPGAAAFTPRGTAVRVVAGVVAVWFSNPAIFVLAGVLSVAFALALAGRDWRRATAVAAVGAAVLASFGAYYLFRILKTDDIPAVAEFLQDFWGRGFPPFPIATWQDLDWYVRWLHSWAWYPVGLDAAGAWVLLGAVGTGLLAWRRPRLCLYLLGPVMFMLAAGVLHRYPAQGRMLLFLAPTAALLVGVGVAAVAGLAGRFAPMAGTILGVAVLAAAAPTARDVLDRPYPYAEQRPLFDFIRAHWQEGDRVYVYGGWSMPDRYYLAATDIPSEARLGRNWIPKEVAFRLPPGVRDGQRDLLDLRAEGRVWVITMEDDRKRISGALDRVGTHLGKFRSVNSALMLYGFAACTGPCLEPLPEPDGDPTLD